MRVWPVVTLTWFAWANRFNPISGWLVDFTRSGHKYQNERERQSSTVSPKGICETIEFYRAEKSIANIIIDIGPSGEEMLAYITKPPTNRKQTITADNFAFFSSYFFCTLYSLLCVLWYTEYKNRKISCKAIHTKVTTIVDAQRISNTCCVARTYLNSWQPKKPGHNQQDVLSSFCEQNVNLVFELYVWIRLKTVQFIMRIVYGAVARATSATYECVMQSTHFISQAIQKKNQQP